MSERYVEIETELPDHPGLDITVTAKVVYSPGEGYFVEDIEATDPITSHTIELTEREMVILENQCVEHARADADDEYESRDPDTRDR